MPDIKYACIYVCRGWGSLAEAACRSLERGGMGPGLHHGAMIQVSVWRGSGWACLLGRTFLSQWGRGGGGSSRVGMLPAHYWTETLKLGGAKQNRQVCLGVFSGGPRKLQGVPATARIHPTYEGRRGLRQRLAPLWIARPRVELLLLPSRPITGRVWLRGIQVTLSRVGKQNKKKANTKS